MRKSFVFATVLLCTTALTGAVSRAEDQSNQLQNLDTLGTGMSKDQPNTELNPQPLPPGRHMPTTELNPQPLPPGIKAPTTNVELNPQPLPPGMKLPTEGTELNPQPLPPGMKAQ